MTPEEFTTFLSDPAKRIEGDITWNPDEDHTPTIEFRAPLATTDGHPTFIRGSVNLEAETLSFAIIHPAHGRLYGLDLGKEHRNPDGEMIGEKHKHTWRNPEVRDKYAYEPDDITQSIPNVVLVWNEFCLEANIEHKGRLIMPGDFNSARLF
jgi:hypothetical protein